MTVFPDYSVQVLSSSRLSIWMCRCLLNCEVTGVYCADKTSEQQIGTDWREYIVILLVHHSTVFVHRTM